MKRRNIILLILILILISTTACSVLNREEDKEIEETSYSRVFSANLDGYTFTPAEGGPGLITSNYGAEEIIDKNYIGLFINGEFIINSGTMIVNDRVEAPISEFAKSMLLEVNWDAAARILSIEDGDNLVTVKIDENVVEKNGEKIQLGKYPEIINDKIYGTSEFFEKAFDAKVSFYNGMDSTATMIIPRLKYAMINRFPTDEVPIPKEAALELLKEDLIIAYEKRYGAYEPAEENVELSVTDPNYEAERLKQGIRDLRVTSENDRFYVIPYDYDFWVDKYTGEIYTFYNGLNMQIDLFNPHTKGALTFAG